MASSSVVLLQSSDLMRMRSAFGRCVDCAHKQIGLRRVATALRVLSCDRILALSCYAEARFLLSSAQALTERGA
jgi:ribosomal protein S27E